MAGRDDWLAIARAADPAEVREHILTGHKSGKPFGRNVPYLKSIARAVVGFDLPPMIGRCRTLAPVPADLLMDDWDDVRTRRFDLVFASLVLQHIEPAVSRSCLEDFARMAPATYLLTRARSDFETNVLDAVVEGGLFDAEECIEVEHDPGSHQLRILGRKPPADVRHSTSGHYEVLLRSRRVR